MDARLGYIAQGKKGEPFTITEAGKAALSTTATGTTTGKSTVSIPNPLPPADSPSPLSTVSTHASACRQPGQAIDTTPDPIPVPSQPLADAERTTLQTFADATRACPSEFVAARKVFPLLDDATHQRLDTLHQHGYLESQDSSSSAYRLSTAGWSALGLRLVKIDLSHF